MSRKKISAWQILFGKGDETPWLLRIGGCLLVLLLFVVVSAAGFRYFDPHYNWLDAFYVTILTVSTLNNQMEGVPITDSSKVWSMLVIIVGIVLVATLGAQIAGFIIEGRIRMVLGRRKMAKRIDSVRGHIIIAGFGRMGALIAQELMQAGREVIIVDHDSQRTAYAESLGILYVLGNAQDDETLSKAGLEHAKYLYATLGDDASNVFITLTARYQNPEVTIISRAQDPSTEMKLRRAGSDRVICPQLIGANHMVDVVIRPVMVDFVEMAHSGVDLEMDQITIDPGGAMVGKTLAELSLPSSCGAHVVAILHPSGETNYNPTYDLVIQPADVLITVGKKNAAQKVHQLNK